MEATRSFETPENIYQTARGLIQFIVLRTWGYFDTIADEMPHVSDGTGEKRTR